MLVVGIDSSLNSTGISIAQVTAQKVEVIDSFLIKPKKSENKMVKVSKIGISCYSLLKGWWTCYGEIELCVIESCLSCRSKKGSISLAQVQGVIFGSIYESGVPLLSVAPSIVKKSVTGSGGASKEEVQRILSRNCMGDLSSVCSDDQWDSVGLCYFAKENFWECVKVAHDGKSRRGVYEEYESEAVREKKRKRREKRRKEKESK